MTFIFSFIASMELELCQGWRVRLQRCIHFTGENQYKGDGVGFISKVNLEVHSPLTRARTVASLVSYF